MDERHNSDCSTHILVNMKVNKLEARTVHCVQQTNKPPSQQNSGVHPTCEHMFENRNPGMWVEGNFVKESIS